MSAFLESGIEDLDGEQWKVINGYKSKYLVSNYGRIKSLKRKDPIILKQSFNSKGYLRVPLSNRGQIEWRFVHRLVALSFITNEDPAENNTVHHINRNKMDNSVNNLQWLSLKQNIREYTESKKKK